MRASMSTESAVLVLAAAVLMAVAVPVASAEQLSGRVEWKTRGSTRPAQAVVFAEPLDRPAPAAPGKGTLQHKNKTFLPHVVAVPAGSTIAFPNDDPIFHNAFSLSSPQPFDMGLYRAGRDETAGVYQAGRVSRVLQHPPADGRLPGRGADAVCDRGGTGRRVASRRARGEVSRYGPVGTCGAGDRGGGGEWGGRQRGRVGAGRVGVCQHRAPQQVRKALSQGRLQAPRHRATAGCRVRFRRAMDWWNLR